jgi:uncharacterized lipoprotein YbaY/heat shock protein HslJ
MHAGMMTATLALGAGLALAGEAAGQAEVTGTAYFRERIALPPGAVFEATLEDVSRADAPSVEIARAGGANWPGPPFAFALPYDPAAIDPRARLNVRARVLVDGRTMFASDTAQPAVAGGAPTAGLEILMVRAEPAAAAPTAGLRGMAVYFADAARFADCVTGRDLPVAMEGEQYIALERALTEAGATPDARVLVTIEGRIEPRARMEGGGDEDNVIVDRVVALWPGASCARATADADLTDTYWRIRRLGETRPEPAEGRREPHLILRAEDGRFAATVGCNQMIGGFEVAGMQLRFGQAASTMMACQPPLDAAERALAETLAATRGWRINGHALELFDDAGAPRALLEAVPPR